MPRGGLNLWLRLRLRMPDDTNLHQLTRDCEDQGVIIVAGDDWFPAEPTRRYLRLNYSDPNPAHSPTQHAPPDKFSRTN